MEIKKEHSNVIQTIRYGVEFEFASMSADECILLIRRNFLENTLFTKAQKKLTHSTVNGKIQLRFETQIRTRLVFSVELVKQNHHTCYVYGTTNIHFSNWSLEIYCTGVSIFLLLFNLAPFALFVVGFMLWHTSDCIRDCRNAPNKLFSVLSCTD